MLFSSAGPMRNGTVSQILSLVGLIAKVIIRSGEKDKKKNEQVRWQSTWKRVGY